MGLQTIICLLNCENFYRIFFEVRDNKFGSSELLKTTEALNLGNYLCFSRYEILWFFELGFQANCFENCLKLVERNTQLDCFKITPGLFEESQTPWFALPFSRRQQRQFELNPWKILDLYRFKCYIATSKVRWKSPLVFKLPQMYRWPAWL